MGAASAPAKPVASIEEVERTEVQRALRDGAGGGAVCVGHCAHCGSSSDLLSEKVICVICKSFVILCERCRSEKYHINDSGSTVSSSSAVEAKPTDTEEAKEAAGEEDEEDEDSSADSAAVAPANSGDEWRVYCAEHMLLSCTSASQLEDFLARFSLSQLESQLAEVNNILAFFHQPKQRKHASKSRNRKHNLHKQRARLEEAINKRRTAEGLPLLPFASHAKDAPTGHDSNRRSHSNAAAGTQQQQLLTFVPLLNV